MLIYCIAHYLELALFFAYSDLLKEMPSNCVCEMTKGFARDLVDSSVVDACGASRPLCSHVASVFVGYVHYVESPCPCLVLLTEYACARDFVSVHYPESLIANSVSAYSACAPSRGQDCLRRHRAPSSNRCPRLSNVAATFPYLSPSLCPTRPSHDRPASCAVLTALQRQPLPHALSFLSSLAPPVPALSLALRVPVHAV